MRKKWNAQNEYAKPPTTAGSHERHHHQSAPYMTNADTKIIPGHGPLADRARVKAYHDMLVVTRDRMRKEIAAKHTVDQVLATKITAEYDKDWPNGRERFLRILYQELSTK